MSLSCKTHRPTQYQQITDGVTYTSSYQYNLSGAMTQETYPSGRVVKNTFDSNGDVARVFGKATPSSVEKTYANSFNYNASGGISAMRLGNGKWETAKFNKRLQVTELGLGHASQDASLWKVNYEFGEYDSNNGLVDTSKNTGNIAKQTVSFNGLAQPFVQTYEYDSLYRLKLAKEEVNGQTDPNWSQSFTYDRYGNRLTHVKEINGSPITHNQQTHPSIDASTNRFSDTSQYGYDKAGNLIADADGRTFTFDGNNKQILVTGSNGTVGEYFYDGDGMRVKKHVYTNGNHNKTIIFVYSGGKLAEEYSTDPVTSPKTKYTTEDHLGTPRIITDETGEVVSRRDFMPFGQEIAKTTGTRSDSSYKYSSNEDDVKQKFTGYQQDSETMLDFAEARMYENRHARFTAVDPLLASGNSGNPQTFNRYVYVGNNPINITDPFGLDWYKIGNKYHWSSDNKTFDNSGDEVSGEQIDLGDVGFFEYQGCIDSTCSSRKTAVLFGKGRWEWADSIDEPIETNVRGNSKFYYLGNGFGARLDQFNEKGKAAFEIHVGKLDKNGVLHDKNQVGIVKGKDGWIGKHGKTGVPKELSKHTLEKVNKINIEALRARGELPKKGQPNSKKLVKNGAYLNKGATVLGPRYIGGATNILSLSSAVITDLETYKRAKNNRVSFKVQLMIDAHKKRFISTPLGVFPTDCRTGGLCIEDHTVYE